MAKNVCFYLGPYNPIESGECSSVNPSYLFLHLICIYIYIHIYIALSLFLYLVCIYLQECSLKSTETLKNAGSFLSKVSIYAME